MKMIQRNGKISHALGLEELILFKWPYWDFPGGPVVKNLPSNAGDEGSILVRGTKIPHAAGQLSLGAVTREACTPQQRTHALKQISLVPQLRLNKYVLKGHSTQSNLQI